MNRNADQALNSFRFLQKDFHQEDGHSSDLDQKRSGILLLNVNHKKNGIELEFKFGESRHPVFRSTSPLSQGMLKSKGGGKLSIHYCADLETIKTVFRTIISVNQLSIYGAVSDLCDECKSCHVRKGRLVLVGQFDPLFVPDRLSQQNRVIKFCTDAGFLTTVEVGQYFVTKDTEEFSQFTDSVACREYTLPRDGKII